jgi:hypothetical protein
MSNINEKNTPNLMRVLMKRMRDGGEDTWQSESVETGKPNLDMRTMLKVSRKMNENAEEKAANRKTVYDQSTEEEKMKNYFGDIKVNITFINLEIYDTAVFWGGTVDGIIQFTYTVTPNDKDEGFVLDYVGNFTPDNPDNQVIIDRLKAYYDQFYKFWNKNLVQQ